MTEVQKLGDKDFMIFHVLRILNDFDAVWML